MKTLILMRHAKSSWAEPGRDDHARPLNGRGRRGAKALGTWLTQTGMLPDTVLCSDAARTQETWRRLDIPGTPGFERALYHAGPAALLDSLRRARGDRVLLIAHNPGIADLACRLAENPPEHPRFAEYPTGATTVMDCPMADWTALDWGACRIRSFVIPADLGVTRK